MAQQLLLQRPRPRIVQGQSKCPRVHLLESQLRRLPALLRGQQRGSTIHHRRQSRIQGQPKARRRLKLVQGEARLASHQRPRTPHALQQLRHIQQGQPLPIPCALLQQRQHLQDARHLLLTGGQIIWPQLRLHQLLHAQRFLQALPASGRLPHMHLQQPPLPLPLRPPLCRSWDCICSSFSASSSSAKRA